MQIPGTAAKQPTPDELRQRLVNERVAERVRAMRAEAVPVLQKVQEELQKRQNLLALRSSIPPVFHPLLKPNRYKGAYGGRGSGKSWAFGCMAIDRALAKPGTRIVCVREVQKSLEQSVKRLLEDLIQKHTLGGRFRILNTHIETPGDGTIIFNGMQNHTAESIKSLEGFDIAWVEEAQSLSERSLTLLRPTIRAADSELWFSWNPRHATDPVDVLLRSKNLPPQACVVEATYKDNPHFPEVLRQEMEWDKARDLEKYQHVWEGSYEKHSEARVFKNWKVEEFETPEDAVLLFGGDWGYSVDPAVLVRLFIQGRRLFVDYEAYKIGVEIDHLPEHFAQVPQSKDWDIIADSSRPDTISYLARHGFPRIRPSIKGKDSVKEGIIFLQSYDIIVHPRCVHTIDEFKHYSYKKDEQTDQVTPYLEDKKNHVIDSIRYAVERLRMKLFGAREAELAGMTSEATW